VAGGCAGKTTTIGGMFPQVHFQRSAAGPYRGPAGLRWKTASGGLSGFRHPRAHSNPRPTGVWAMKPAVGLTQSPMDKLDYGLSEPQMVLLKDGSVFLAGQVQAPMDPPPVANNPQAMRRGMAADIASTSLTTGMTLLGTISSSRPFILDAYPEEAAYVLTQNGGKQVSTVLTLNSDLTPVRVPSLTRISIPLPYNATGASSPELPIGTNTDERYFILKIRKPWKGYKIGKIWVNLNVGSAKQVIQNGLAVTGDGPNSSGAGFYQVLRGNVDTSGDKRSWMATWLPAMADPNGLIEYYRVRVTCDQNLAIEDMMNIQYGYVYDSAGVRNLPPPGHYMCYDFAIQGKDPFDFYSYYTSTCKVIGLWSAAQTFQNSYFGDWDNDKWTSYMAYSWLTNPLAQNFLLPLNDITLEHGNNGIHQQHFDGNEFDMGLPPGFNRTILVNHLNNAWAENGTGPHTTALRTWVNNTRPWIQNLLTNTWFDPNGLRIESIEFLPDLNHLDPTDHSVIGKTPEATAALQATAQSCAYLWQLLFAGSCINEDDSTQIRLSGLSDWNFNEFTRIHHDGGLTHTTHVHVRLAQPLAGWTWGLSPADH